MNRDLLTENEVIQGVVNFLSRKGRTSQKRLISKADAEKKEHGIDLVFKLENQQGRGNWYFIEAKGNKKADGSKMRSSCNTNFRWALSQIILRIEVDSRKNNYIYGIALPKSDAERCMKLIRKNWALKHLKIRIYGVFYNEDQLTATEYLPREVYD